MSRLIRALLITIAVSILTPVYAKRMDPKPVEPAVFEGVRYSAPNENGRVAMVRATEAATGKILWEQEIFSTHIRPDLEEDVQWVFIRSLRLDKELIIVIAENARAYSLDPRTRKVKNLTPTEPWPVVECLGLLTCAVLIFWLVMGRFKKHAVH